MGALICKLFIALERSGSEAELVRHQSRMMCVCVDPGDCRRLRDHIDAMGTGCKLPPSTMHVLVIGIVFLNCINLSLSGK